MQPWFTFKVRATTRPVSVKDKQSAYEAGRRGQESRCVAATRGLATVIATLQCESFRITTRLSGHISIDP